MRKALSLSCGVLAVTAACARNYNPDPDMQPDPGKGYVLETTGAVIGRDDPRRTDEPDSTVGAVATRLAGQICEREARCHGSTSVIEPCMRMYVGLAAIDIALWQCSPAATRARAKTCIAALSGEPCELDLSTKPELCAPSDACPETTANLIPPGAVLATTGLTSARHPASTFDREAAAAALAAVDVASCREPLGPKGAGHVTVTFAPVGSVATAVLDEGTDPTVRVFEGTPTGDCILARFRAVQVPKFEGGPVKVGKRLSID
jgi:hypothetical protein